MTKQDRPSLIESVLLAGACVALAFCNDSTSQMTDAESEATHDSGGEGQCGLSENDKLYLGPCRLTYGPDQISTLCDELTQECFAPVENCGKGWCRIPAASFQSGQSDDGLQVENTSSAGITVVHRNFEIMESEVSLEDFERTMGYMPANLPPCPECAVGGASIFEAMEFANRLSIASGVAECYELRDCHAALASTPPDTEFETWVCTQAIFAGADCDGFRLPSAAEWELAARAGSPTCLAGGPLEPSFAGCDPENFDQRGRYCGNANVDYDTCYDEAFFVPCPVGPGLVRITQRNPFGLYNTAGNVSELTQSKCPRELGTPRAGPPFGLVDDTLTPVLASVDPACSADPDVIEDLHGGTLSG